MPLKESRTIKQPIYLDYNASTPHAPEVIEAMRPFLETYFGNPSSASVYGKVNKEALEQARGQVAGLLGCHAEEIIFTSGGTESNNHAIKGVAFAHRAKGNHIITSQIEHPAVLEVCGHLEKCGFSITTLPVDATGSVRVQQVKAALTPRTILVSIMHANNEVGTVQPLEQIAELTRSRGILLHTDAAQSVGKIPTDVESLGVDLLSLAGHKLYAPKGVGALYVRKGVLLDNLLHGAGHEGGRRPGTENILEIVGLGAACALAQRGFEKHVQHLQAMRELLHQGLKRIVTCTLNGHPTQRLPNTLNVSFEGVNAQQLLWRVRDRVAASTGAACHENSVSISHVLAAMNTSTERALGAVRFSVGRMTTEKQVEAAIDHLAQYV